MRCSRGAPHPRAGRGCSTRSTAAITTPTSTAPSTSSNSCSSRIGSGRFGQSISLPEPAARTRVRRRRGRCRFQIVHDVLPCAKRTAAAGADAGASAFAQVPRESLCQPRRFIARTPMLRHRRADTDVKRGRGRRRRDPQRCRRHRRPAHTAPSGPFRTSRMRCLRSARALSGYAIAVELQADQFARSRALREQVPFHAGTIRRCRTPCRSARRSPEMWGRSSPSRALPTESGTGWPL